MNRSKIYIALLNIMQVISDYICFFTKIIFKSISFTNNSKTIFYVARLYTCIINIVIYMQV